MNGLAFLAGLGCLAAAYSGALWLIARDAGEQR
jgi:hypothetical protein